MGPLPRRAPGQREDQCCESYSPPPNTSNHVYEDTTLRFEGNTRTSQYRNVSSQDHASQHNGDNYYAPVTFKQATAAHAVPECTRDDERLSFVQSLAFNEMDSRYMAVHPHLIGTCEWLLATPEYRRWRDPDLLAVHNGFLWIKGKAGAGKSTLMKYASGRAAASCVRDQHVLTFFFNARGGPLETSTDGLFRSLLKQMLEKIPRLYDSIDKRLLGLVKRQGWTSALLRDHFRDAVMGLGKHQVSCYIDAMDECRDEDIEDIIQLFEDLGDFVAAHETSFHVCLSSRHYPNLRFSKNIQLALEHQQGHDADIQEYLQRRLVIDEETLKEDLMESIKTKAAGVFLWVVLVVALIVRDDRRGNAQEIYKRFDQIPRKLSDLFTDLIERNACNKHFRPLLQWVTFCRYPLNPKSLYCALMHATESASQSNTNPPSLEPANVAKFLLESSKGLVETTPDDRVQFIHESLRKYFLGEGFGRLLGHDAIRDSKNQSREDHKSQSMAVMTARCHDQLKELCLRYVMQISPMLDSEIWAHEHDYNYSLRRVERRINTSFPFFRYAIYGVLSHANTAQNLGIQQQEFLNALDWHKIGKLFEVERAHFDEDWIDWTDYEFYACPTGPSLWYQAYVTAKLGYYGLLKGILKMLPRPEMESDSAEWGPILITPMEKLNVQGVSMILEAGADPNSSCDDVKSLDYALYNVLEPGSTLCGYSSSRDWDWDLDLNSDSDLGADLHSSADQANALAITELLLSHGATPDIDSFTCYFDRACSEYQNRGLLRILLGGHLESNIQTSNYKDFLAKALGIAGLNSRFRVVRSIVSKGVEKNFWSHGPDHTRADREKCIQVKFEEEPIMLLVLTVLSPKILRCDRLGVDDSVVRVLPSILDPSVPVHLPEGTTQITDLVLQFKLHDTNGLMIQMIKSASESYKPVAASRSAFCHNPPKDISTVRTLRQTTNQMLQSFLVLYVVLRLFLSIMIDKVISYLCELL